MKLLAGARQRPMSSLSVRLRAGLSRLIVVGGIVLAALGVAVEPAHSGSRNHRGITAGG